MTTLTASRVAELPRVNLLPPEIGEASRLRRLQVLLGLALLAVLGVVGMLFVWASGQVSSAEEELATAQAEGTSLQAQVAEYAEVPRVLGEVDAAETALVTAMQPEIRFSFFLNDLSLTTPKSSRLMAMTVTNAESAVQMDGVSAAVPTQLGEPTMGTVTFTGRSTSLDGVAAWLQSLAKQEGYVGPTFQSAVKEDPGATQGTVFTVSSTTSLSVEAASNRYEQILESE
jgi:Tfp pilus assembly protein PilN